MTRRGGGAGAGGRPEKELDPAAGPVQRFAYALRKLRAEAGSPTYRAMAETAGFSAPTLSGAAAGEKLPSLPVLLGYVAACGGDAREWEERWRAAVAERSAPDPDDSASPYPGLARFDPADRAHFHGRDELIRELAGLVARRRICAVTGASGSGKSSLLRAGLVPLLRAGGSPEKTVDRPAGIRILAPGGRPARTHRDRFAPVDGPGDTVIVVDQFEEVFSLCHDTAERDAFIALLLRAVRPEHRLRVVLAVRADFYGRLAEHGPLADALRDATLLVGPMPAHALREAVVRPAATERLVVERALTARVVADTEGRPGGLPLMAHALREVWRRRNGTFLTLAAYEAVGGLEGAVAHTAEDVYGRLDADEAAAARALLLRMVAPGDGTPDTRRPVDRAELAPGSGIVLERLVTARLLTVDGDLVDLAHEALITSWPRLRRWVDADRGRLRVHRALTEAARAWADLERDAGALYRGARLASAREVFGVVHLELTHLEREFLGASVAAHERELRAAVRSTRRLRTLSAALAGLLCVALVAAGVARQQSRAADRQRAAAEARSAAALADRLRTSDPRLAQRLSVAAWRIADTPETRSAVRAAAAQPGRDAVTVPGQVSVLSADGRLATAVEHDKVTQWDVPRHRRLWSATVPGVSDGFLSLSEDGRRLAYRTDGAVTLRDLPSGRTTTLPISELGDGPSDLTPDGRFFIVAGKSGAELWETASGRRLLTVPGYRTGSRPYPSLSPDGRLLAVCTRQGLRFWDVGERRQRPRVAPESVAMDVCANGDPDYRFTPDGHGIAYALHDGVHIWDLRTRRPRQALATQGPPGAFRFSADGRYAVILSHPEITVRRTSDGRSVARIAGLVSSTSEVRIDSAGHAVRYQHGAGATVVSTATFGSDARRSAYDRARWSPDGRTLVTVENGRVRLRSAADGSLRRTLPGRACADCGDSPMLGFGPGGRTLAYGDPHEVRLVDVRTGRELLHARLDFNAWLFAVGGDNRSVVAAGQPAGIGDNDHPRVEAWRLKAGGTGERLLRKSTGGEAIALTRDTVLTSDGVLHDLEGGRTRRVVHGEGRLRAAESSPDGRLVAAVDGEGRVTLWRAGNRLGVLRRPDGREGGTVLAFSPDSRRLAAGGADGDVQVWETEAPHLSGTPLPAPAPSPVLGLAFTPDGDALRVATARGSRRTHLMNEATAADTVCARAGGPGRTEWQTYLPGLPYREVC
ncbi:hypothetical protein GTY65_01075 [Streptomyces sp. SID8379]|uniref:AAA family ATPase n=1 Tax=unclassified Streptomyces TaxID=2593676 RepID=UPI00039F5DC9|nr:MULTISPECIES: AAA family ATPase [unclassified Streptomyces]MYW62678.1 hypothetical protein [Streptomyces sp. SID8379]